jgi:biotin carboxyl carrier protein
MVAGGSGRVAAVKLELAIDGKKASIEILSPPPECRFRFADVERSANVALAEPCVYSILLEGRVYDARIERRENLTIVVIDGYRFQIEVCDPRRWSRQPALGSQGVATLAAPMPGKVVRLLAAPGDAVAAGQGILVVEAMKMQNEMKAPRAGRVASLTAVEGAIVAAGEVLATIE